MEQGQEINQEDIGTLRMELNKKELAKLFDVLFGVSVKNPQDGELSDLLKKVLKELQNKQGE